METINKIKNAYRLFNRDQPAFFCRLRAEIKRKLTTLPRSKNIKLGEVLFPYNLEISPQMDQIYYGDYELVVAALLKKFLKPGMTFLDIGANVGYFSALGLSLVGTSGRVFAFEPVPILAARLKSMGALNPDYKIVCNDFGLGDKEATTEIAIFGNKNIGWNTMVPNFMDAADVSSVAQVKIRCLDHYLTEERVNHVDLIKIDVEGYEFPVLQGAKKFLEKTKPTIICEIAPAAYAKLHTSLAELQIFMKQLGYRIYDSNLRPLDLTSLSGTTDVIFMAA